VAIAGAAVVVGAGTSTEAASTGKCDTAVQRAGNWLEIKPPFKHAPAEVKQVVQTPWLPDRMWVTNGTDVLWSQDAGCHWLDVVHPVPGSLLGSLPAPVSNVLPTSTTTTVAKIAAPSSSTTTARVYVGLEDSALLSDGLRIGYFDGNGWRYDAEGLPSAGHITELAAAPSVPNVAYALIEAANALSDGGLYATKDGGETWEQINASLLPSDVTDIKVDPGVPNLLYGMGREGVVRSDDGGRNWSTALHAVPDSASYDVASGNGSVRIVQGRTGVKRFDRSDNAGASWHLVTAPVAAREVAMMPVLDNVAVSDGKSLWIESKGLVGQARNVTPPRAGVPTQLQFSAPAPTGYALVGARGASIYRSTYNLAGKVIRQPLKPVTLLGQNPPETFPSTLLPGKTTLTLPPGGHQDVDYRLILPRTPSAVDVMFLVDTSASMSQTIEGLKKDLAEIINELSGAGLDVQFGLGDFKDYASTGECYGNGESSDYPYQLDVKVGRVAAELREALNALKSRGGGDPAESQLTALYQSTTGRGQYCGKKHLVAPGGDAGYRPDALKLAVLATDDRFHHEGYYWTPSWDETLSALRAGNVHPIGLALNTYSEESQKLQGFRSYADEQRLARDMGSVVPRGGVDCNGDLAPDLAAGAPFVCKVPVVLESHFDLGQQKNVVTPLPVRLAPAISTAAESLADLKRVGLTFNARGAAGRDEAADIARLVQPVALPLVNLKTDNTLSFTVRYTCPKLKKPHTYMFDVDASDGSRTFASSTSRIACGAVPPPPKKPDVPVGETVAVAAPAAAAAAPPAPGQPVTNGNPNPNPALNANVGFASQEEEQRQLAFATETGLEDDTSTELAMSRLLVGTAALTTLAFGAAYATRRRTQLAHARATWHH
jgi:hypothetical protein